MIFNDKLQHLDDSLQWKIVDSLFLEFGNKERNLKLKLCIDEMNHHSNLSSKHNTWLVLLVIYNLAP